MSLHKSTDLPRVYAPALPNDSRPEQALSARWLLVALVAIGLAGVFSLIPLIGRTPIINEWITDPLFARRWLVVHVNLALIVWFYAFLAAVAVLIAPRRRTFGYERVLPHLALLGVATFTVMGLFPTVEPVLANYIPVLDHPVFLLGLVLFAVAVSASLLTGRLLPGARPAPVAPLVPAAVPGLRVAAVAIVLALITFTVSFATIPRYLPASAYYEVLFWGGGHVLQFANIATMVALWLVLLRAAGLKRLIAPRLAAVLFALMILPAFLGPYFASIGASTNESRAWFVFMMRWCMFPVLSLFMLILLVQLGIGWRRGELFGRRFSPALVGFVVSVVMTLIGFALGAMAQLGTTLVPAHYHVSIGAVTVAFMAGSYLLIQAYGGRFTGLGEQRMASRQLLYFGVGQVIFALGLALAGTTGMQRKVYGSEQVTRTTEELVGLAVMGFGGLFAISGGVLFLWIVISMWLRRGRPHPPRAGAHSKGGE